MASYPDPRLGLRRMIPNYWYAAEHSVTSGIALTAIAHFLGIFIIPTAVTFTRISCNVTAAGGVGTTLASRFYFSDPITGLPAAAASPLLDAMDTASIGLKDIALTTALSLPAGRYWIDAKPKGTAVAATVTGAYGNAAVGNVGPMTGQYAGHLFVTGAAVDDPPATLVGATIVDTNTMPRIFLKATTVAQP